VPGTQWLLFVGGPRVGPAVLFWSLLLILVPLAIALGIHGPTPLRWWHWLLLAVGLSQVHVVAAAVFVGWLLALGWRARTGAAATIDRRAYNAQQFALVAWTFVALGILVWSLVQGLLGPPEMQVDGNGSSASQLRWFTDRAGAVLPHGWMFSVPLLVYRAAMLAWALWIARALLDWLRWGWGALTAGGIWKKREITRAPTPVGLGPPPGPAPPGPVPPGNPGPP
jgi:hypothetical protein